MDSEARVYLVLVVVLLALLGIVGSAFFWALRRGDRYEASARAARKAAARAADERDAVVRILKDLRGPISHLPTNDTTAVIPRTAPAHAVPSDAPTMLVPQVRQLNGHRVATDVHEAT